MKLKYIFFVVKVEGESAFPDLIPGRYYLASNLKKPKIGRFLVFSNPLHLQEIFVKKISAVREDGFEVQGTVSWATSSKDLGIIPQGAVLGVIVK